MSIIKPGAAAPSTAGTTGTAGAGAGWKVLHAALFVLLLANLRRQGLTCLVSAPVAKSSYKLSSPNDMNNDFYTKYLQLISNRVPAAGIETILLTSSLTPAFHFFAHTTQNDLVTASLIQTGVYEKDSTTALIQAIVCETAPDGNRPVVVLDMGANIGFHSLHMASCGATVVAFEASPDTAWLLQSSARLNGYYTTDTSHLLQQKGSSGSLLLIPRGLSNVTNTKGLRLSRHAKSPGMTSFVDAEKTPYGLKGGERGSALDVNIPMVRAADVLDSLLLGTSSPSTKSTSTVSLKNKEHQQQHGNTQYQLRLLKIDVEGYEYQALQGLDLDKYPFEYITLEFFPTLLQASGTDPAELLVYIWSHGYRFLKFDAAVKLEDYPEVEMTTSEQQPSLQNPNDNSNDKAAVYQWAQHLMAQGRAASGDDYHVNLLAKKMFY